MIAEHIEPVMLQIEKLEEALYSIQFEQHWLLAQTDRQAIGTLPSCTLAKVTVSPVGMRFCRLIPNMIMSFMSPYLHVF